MQSRVGGDDTAAAAAAAAVVAYVTSCPDPHRALGRRGGDVRQQLARDLCGIVVGSRDGAETEEAKGLHVRDGDWAETGDGEEDGEGCLRDACMIDYAPALTAPKVRTMQL